MLFATLQRTEEILRAAPTPIIDPVIVWVVDTGMPSQVVAKSVAAPPVSAQKPCIGVRRVIFDLSFPKISTAQIRAMRQNQRIIRDDDCDPSSVCNVRRRPVQAATQARSRKSVSPLEFRQPALDSVSASDCSRVLTSAVWGWSRRTA